MRSKWYKSVISTWLFTVFQTVWRNTNFQRKKTSFPSFSKRKSQSWKNVISTWIFNIFQTVWRNTNFQRKKTSFSTRGLKLKKKIFSHRFLTFFSIPRVFGKIKISHPKSHVFQPALENCQFYIGFFSLDFSRILVYFTKPMGNLHFPNQLKVIAQISNLQL